VSVRNSMFFQCLCCRVLCEIVKDFVYKVGAESAKSNPDEANDPGSLSQKVTMKWLIYLSEVSGSLTFVWQTR